MGTALGMYLLGALLLLLGGDSVLRGVAGLGQRLGLSPFRAGLLMAALAVAIPQWAIVASAAAHGQGELALGSALGGNLVLLGLVLGTAALIAPIKPSMRWLALARVLVPVAAGLVLLLGRDGQLSRLDGVLLLIAFVAALVAMLRQARDETAPVQAEFEAFAVTTPLAWRNLLRLVFAAALLYFGARFLVQSAPELGASLGWDPLRSGRVLGGIGSALPVLAIAAMASLNGQGNAVVASVLGAMLANLLAAIGALAAWAGLAVPARAIAWDLPAAVAVGLVAFFLLSGARAIDRRSAGLLMAGFALWLVLELLLPLG